MAIVFTNSGHSGAITRIIGSGTQPSYMAWGTGATGAGSLVADNTLFGEANTRVQGTAAAFSSALTNDTFQVVGILSATAAYTITNAGVFDASTLGSLYIKGDVGPLTLANGDSIQFTVRLQFS